MPDLVKLALHRHRKVPIELNIPTPPVGGKCICLDHMGSFMLARGAGILRSIAVTNAGSAYMTLYDGLSPVDGRPLFVFAPVVLGCWMLDIGFEKGLVVELEGGFVPMSTIVWVEKGKQSGKPPIPYKPASKV